jgi:PAS domain S-box-containing protein
MENLLADIIDIRVIQSFMNDFYKLANMPIGINDLKGNVLVSAGWQDICTKFHRVHPQASKYCVESDTKLASAATPHELKIYQCKNNMWDIVTPIMLEDQRVGYIFSGQFFFDDEPLDYELFRSQARKYGFDEGEYMAALNKVPRLSRKTVETGMSFLMAFANTLSQLSYSNFKQAQLLEERNALVNALQESEERFHTMANAIPQLAWISRPDGYICWFNERWYSYTGTTPKQTEGWGWQIVHDPEVLPKVLERWKASISTGQLFDMELPLRSMDGIFRSFLTRILPLKDAAGNILWWFGTSTDVTELKKNEEVLKETRDSLEEKVKERTTELGKAYNLLKKSEKRLAEAQKMSHIGNWGWDLITNQIYLSEEFYRIFNCSRESVPSYNEYLSYVNPKDREHVDNAFKKAINGEPCSIDHRIILANGEEHTVHLQSEAIFDEKKIPIRLNGIVQDITERKKAEEKIQSLANIVESSNDAIITISLDGIVTSWNKGAEQIYGYSSEEIIGKSISILAPDKLKGETKKLIEKVKMGERIRSYRTSRLRKDDKLIFASITLSPVFDSSNELVAISAITRDITERKKAGEVLKLKLEELARSNEELEQFAYVSSHDLQEPLWMITGYLQLLQRRYQGELDDKADKYINYAVEGAFRMQNLINDLLEFSRVTTITREPEFMDCEFILNQVLSNLKVFIIENNATVSYDSLPEIMADSIQLVQIFQNLIINGIKFHDEKAPKIHISVEKKANEWLFSVQDNGIGIDPRYFKKIFEIFKRLHKREEYPGTGIGLAICKKIIEKQGGCIWVESELSKGSTFYFTLPINSIKNLKTKF